MVREPCSAGKNKTWLFQITHSSTTLTYFNPSKGGNIHATELFLSISFQRSVLLSLSQKVISRMSVIGFRGYGYLLLVLHLNFPLSLAFSNQDQRFSKGVLWHAGVLQEFLKRATPDCVVQGPDLFSLRLSNWQCRQPTQQLLSDVNESKLYLFLSGQQNKCISWCATEFYKLVCARHEVKKAEHCWSKSKGTFQFQPFLSSSEILNAMFRYTPPPKTKKRKHKTVIVLKKFTTLVGS